MATNNRQAQCCVCSTTEDSCDHPLHTVAEYEGEQYRGTWHMCGTCLRDSAHLGGTVEVLSDSSAVITWR